MVQIDHDAPVYKIIDETGPAHDKRFIASVSVSGKVLATGEGHSKKEAEANAALKAIDN